MTKFQVALLKITLKQVVHLKPDNFNAVCKIKIVSNISFRMLHLIFLLGRKRSSDL